MGTITRLTVTLFLLVCYSLLGREYGPPVGARMVGFELKDQEDKLRTLANILGPKGAIILFYRSADW
jgi:hypothetical protein